MDEIKFITSGIWEPKVNKPVRITFVYKDSIRPFVWVVVKQDGSILLGKAPSGKTSFPKIGTSVAKNGSLNIKYTEGTEIKEPDAAFKAKLSFHASGIVKSNIPDGGVRTFNKSLRDISEPVYLCSILFQHPLHFKTIETIRKQDIVLKYPFDEKSPCACDVYAAPLGYQSLPIIQNAKEQVPVILWYKNLDLRSDLEVRMFFYHNADGPWPPFTYIVWKSEKKNDDS